MSNKLNKTKVLDFIKSNTTTEIATVINNKPSVAVVVYVTDKKLNFYFVTHVGTRKAKNLLKNPYISLAIWEHYKMLIQADGKATVVKDKKTKDWVMDGFADIATADPNFWAPIFKMSGSDYIIFKITPKWIRALDLSESTVNHKGSPFTEIKL